MTARCDQCGQLLPPHAFSPKWCSRTRRWSDTDRRKRPVTENPVAMEARCA